MVLDGISDPKKTGSACIGESVPSQVTSSVHLAGDSPTTYMYKIYRIHS